MTVSYPFKIGKRKVLKLALSMSNKLSHIALFGMDNSLEVTSDVTCEARQFSASLCGHQGCNDLNSLRRHIFASKKSDLRVLPPTEDAFKYHLQLSLFQYVWYKRAHLDNPAMPLATEFGRQIINGTPIMTSLPSKMEYHVL